MTETISYTGDMSYSLTEHRKVSEQYQHHLLLAQALFDGAIDNDKDKWDLTKLAAAQVQATLANALAIQLHTLSL